MTHYDTFESPVGTVFVGGSDEGLHRVDFFRDAKDLAHWIEALERDGGSPAVHDPAAMSEVTRQLGEYFAGERTTFDLPLAPRGTDFQRRVWNVLRTIGYGRTSTYGAIASTIGQPSASRAVGLANGHNPLAIVVPCHRVIGASGALTGYAGGLDRKRWLLQHEIAEVAETAQPRLLEVS
jgi:methylated-DNA-[protein]-cysteine S-methyltransferase